MCCHGVLTSGFGGNREGFPKGEWRTILQSFVNATSGHLICAALIYKCCCMRRDVCGPCLRQGRVHGGPKCAYKDVWRISSIYHNMINLVFSIEIRRSPSRLVDIKVLESGARDVLCGSEGYQSEAIVACFSVQYVCRLLGQRYLLSPFSH